MSLFRPAPCLFFFYDPSTTDIYTLSLHDALPIFALDERDRRAVLAHRVGGRLARGRPGADHDQVKGLGSRDRKSTRLNSSHRTISYAVFCLKKKKKQKQCAKYYNNYVAK